MCHPDARYRGAENQLYRVEIHLPGKARSSSTTTVEVASPASGGSSSSTPTFKCRGNNGCDVYPVISVKAAEVMLGLRRRDVRSTLKSGDWVELLDDILILQGKPGQLLQVSEVSAQDRRVTLGSASTHDFVAKDPNHAHAFLSPLGQKDPATEEPAPAFPSPKLPRRKRIHGSISKTAFRSIHYRVESQSSELSSGGNLVAPVNVYRTGDYWLIPRALLYRAASSGPPPRTILRCPSLFRRTESITTIFLWVLSPWPMRPAISLA